MLRFLISAWITISGITSVPEVVITENNHLILVEYTEANLNDLSLIDKNNYLLKDSYGVIYTINTIGIVSLIIMDDLPGGTIVPLYTTVVVLSTERLEYKKEYVLTVSNIKDNNGIIQDTDSSWFYYSGFHPNLINTPNAKLERK